ncbi:effector-associated domain 2-containing protein [Plantactinospora sp. KLBMP9567]|uniref:effector-associated domain 2-containing protein n=1 Tax=Plantactinospora sp. KLBMP9567 TaxID=3085900 RepID=UPI003990BD08
MVDIPDAAELGLVPGTVIQARPIIGSQVDDIALVRLWNSVNAQVARLAGTNTARRVRIFGFPPGSRDGLWISADLEAQPDPRTGWRRLRSSPREVGTDHGFVGAPAYDPPTGAVLGITTTRIDSAGRTATWVVPTTGWTGRLARTTAGAVIRTNESPRSLTLAQKRSLVDSLIEIPVMADPQGRRLVVDMLPANLRRAVPVHPVASLDVFGLVDTLLRFPHGFRELYAVIAILAHPTTVNVARFRDLMVNYGLDVEEGADD